MISEIAENEIAKVYFDPSQGLVSSKQIYDKLNKKYTLKQVKEVLSKIKNNQIKTSTKKTSKLFIPIVSP